MISRARPSTVSRRPITERSPPNRECQYPFISMIVSGVPGLSSRPEKQRPSAGKMPNSGKVASVTKRMSTFSGSPRVGHARRPAVPRGDVPQGPVLLAIGEIQEWGDMQFGKADPFRRVRHADQLFGIRIRQRLQKDTLQHAENGRIGADSESQGEDGNRGETGRVADAAENLSVAHYKIIRRNTPKMASRSGQRGQPLRPQLTAALPPNPAAPRVASPVDKS